MNSFGKTGALLSACDARIGYGDRAILDGVNLEIHKGERWFFLGPNGSGKTTLLHGLLGLLRPQGGEFSFDSGFDRSKELGFVPQRSTLSPALPTTVGEFLNLGIDGLSLSKAAGHERICWALQEVGLQGKEDADYWALSVGQRQRALVARALARHPRLLCLDEPTQGFDLPTEEFLLERLDQHSKQTGMAWVLVAHEFSQVVRYATHVALFGGGRVLAGRAPEVLTDENIEEAYGVKIPISRHLNGGVS